MDYKRPLPLFNRHLETIYPALMRKVEIQAPVRERITTPDADFLDLDWYGNHSEKLIILSHGLEGNSRRCYVLGMARTFWQAGFDVLAWNYRGCSGDMNKALRFYHSGATDDLDTVVQYAQGKSSYKSIGLIGFSLGGNVTLKYLGEGHDSVRFISKAVAISTPLNLSSSCDALSQKENWIYVRRFLLSLTKKVREKSRVMAIPDIHKLDSIKTLRAFDDHFTGPLHGFANAADYYQQCSSINFLKNISTPTLVINARNDPFLSLDCYPENTFTKALSFAYPAHGGHVGFALFNEKKLYWSEWQALNFVRGHEQAI